MNALTHQLDRERGEECDSGIEKDGGGYRRPCRKHLSQMWTQISLSFLVVWGSGSRAGLGAPFGRLEIEHIVRQHE